MRRAIRLAVTTFSSHGRQKWPVASGKLVIVWRFGSPRLVILWRCRDTTPRRWSIENVTITPRLRFRENTKIPKGMEGGLLTVAAPFIMAMLFGIFPEWSAVFKTLS